MSPQTIITDPTNTPAGANTAAPSSNTAAPTAAPTATPPVDTRTEGEKLADQYNGFVETPMDLKGRTIRIASYVGGRYDYVKTKEGKDDVANTNTQTIKVIEILKGIEKDYNCKFEVTPGV